MTDLIRERDAGNCWSRGIDWCVWKDGRKWRAAECFGLPLAYKTKRDAYDACTVVVLAAARRRALERSTA
jgi:hypothetical protein